MVIILLLLPLALLLVPASHAQSTVTTVRISGQVSNSIAGTTTVRADATGSKSALLGAGTDGPPFPGVSGNPGVCQFPLTGSVSRSAVTLSGTATQSSIPDFVGTHVEITASASGDITFTFGPIPSGLLAGSTFTFTGSGTVVITTA
jgi:hypothetical protein